MVGYPRCQRDIEGGLPLGWGRALRPFITGGGHFVERLDYSSMLLLFAAQRPRQGEKVRIYVSALFSWRSDHASHVTSFRFLFMRRRILPERATAATTAGAGVCCTRGLRCEAGEWSRPAAAGVARTYIRRGQTCVEPRTSRLPPRYFLENIGVESRCFVLGGSFE